MAVILSSRRGAGLVDVMVTVFLVAMAGLIFATAFPAATSCSRQAQEYKIATSLAQMKMEQLRSLKYELDNTTYLSTNGILDADTTDSFTNVGHIAEQLTNGTGTLELEDIADDMIKITVTVSWISSSRAINRSVKLITYVVDKRTRKVT